MRGRYTGDDLVNNRLLSILNKSVPFSIKKIKKIRGSVFLLETGFKTFILKGFSSLPRLQVQEAFTSSLKSEGFVNSYSFYRFTEDPIYFNKKYYGLIEYIEPHRERFSYLTAADRLEGLNLLHTFHLTTKRISKKYERILPQFNLYEKWVERKKLFTINSSIIKNYLPKEMMNELLEWGNDSLNGIKNETLRIEDEPPVILHGDVAHHNYLRSTSGRLFLIDFDLISIGPESIDLLQYANRILPFINWSFTQLSEYPLFDQYLQNRTFLFALMYPSDIFREWNRIIKEKSYILPNKLLPVLELTTEQFQLRKQFIKELKNVVK
ncbi:phosphotransferase [Neobacillus sp. LXY-4]|uniref:phosphotransferase n=1 Tax=Neobacillus sp. LXY-4 TaxID=3379826 RepID=UPI003EE0C345